MFFSIDSNGGVTLNGLEGWFQFIPDPVQRPVCMSSVLGLISALATCVQSKYAMKPCYSQGKQPPTFLQSHLPSVGTEKQRDMPAVLSKRSCRLSLTKILQAISFTANGSKKKAIE